ncbi:MAG: winged helix-turn-helix transcriptional regulator [Muribaculaceae bacterium]
MRNIIARVTDKWSLLVMHTLLHAPDGAMRFSALSRAIPDVSQKVLTQTLRRLEEDGFVERTLYAQVPPRVDYNLTPRAMSFMEACTPMVEWASAHMAEIIESRQQHK